MYWLDIKILQRNMKSQKNKELKCLRNNMTKYKLIKGNLKVMIKIMNYYSNKWKCSRKRLIINLKKQMKLKRNKKNKLKELQPQNKELIN